MLDRLQRAVEVFANFPHDAQETAAEHLELLAVALRPAPRRSHAGIWADLPDDMEATLDQWRHAVPPTPYEDLE